MFRDLSMPVRKVNGGPCTDTAAEADKGCDHDLRWLSCLRVWPDIMDITIAIESLKSSIAIPNMIPIPTPGRTCKRTSSEPVQRRKQKLSGVVGYSGGKDRSIIRQRFCFSFAVRVM